MKKNITDTCLSHAVIKNEYAVNIGDSADNEIVIAIVRDNAKSIGFKLSDEVMIAACASELTTNIIRYAQKGKITVRTVCRLEIKEEKIGIEIEAVDKGQGIKDIGLAMRENYTTTIGSLGMGLPTVRNYMDEFSIESGSESGTHIKARKWL